MNSRDRLSNGELRKQIEEELEHIVCHHTGLRELRERRRSEEIASRLEESKPLESILDSILKTSPTLSRLFILGQRLNRPERADSESQADGGGQGNVDGGGVFEPKPEPTYFHFFKKKYGERLVRTAEIDRRCRIKFQTDAQNDYFERAHMPGRYEVDVIDGPLEGADLSHSVTIHNGIANWSINLPDDQVDVDDQLMIQCTVTDDTMLEPFVNLAQITIAPREESSTVTKKGSRTTNTSGGESGAGGTGPSGKNGHSRGPGATTSGGIALPDITQVKRNDPAWVANGFDDTTACKVIEDGDEDQSSYTFYINVDNVYLRTEMKESDADVAIEKTKFIWANVLIGLALLHDAKSHPDISDDNSENETVFSRIDRITRALGPFLIPMIDHLGAITQDDVVHLAQRGDDD